MGPKRILSNFFSVFTVKFKKLGFSAPLIFDIKFCNSVKLSHNGILVILFFERGMTVRAPVKGNSVDSVAETLS